MIVNLTKNEIKHLVYLLGKGDEDYPELNNNLLNKLQPLIDAAPVNFKEKTNEIRSQIVRWRKVQRGSSGS